MIGEVILFAFAGAAGGLIRAIITGEGVLPLPKLRRGRLDLGFLSAVVIGAFAGVLAPYELGVNGLIAAMAGYIGTDAIENLFERVAKHRGSIT